MLPAAVLGGRALLGASRLHSPVAKAALGKGPMHTAAQASSAQAKGQKMLQTAAQSAARWAQDKALEHATAHVQTALEKHVSPEMAASLASAGVTQGHSLLTMMAGLALGPKHERPMHLARGSNALQKMLSLGSDMLMENCETLANTAIGMSQQHLPGALANIEQTIDTFVNRDESPDHLLNSIVERFINSVGEKVASMVAQRHEKIHSDSGVNFTQADVVDGKRMLESPREWQDFLDENVAWQAYKQEYIDQKPADGSQEEGSGHNASLAPNGAATPREGDALTSRGSAHSLLEDRDVAPRSPVNTGEGGAREKVATKISSASGQLAGRASQNVNSFLRNSINNADMSKIIERAVKIVNDFQEANKQAVSY